jgi:hypothetical protein
MVVICGTVFTPSTSLSVPVFTDQRSVPQLPPFFL